MSIFLCRNILCVLERKSHDIARSTIHLCQYSSFYARQVPHHYLGVVMMVVDKHCPQLVCNDPHGQFLVFKLAGIYDPNNATQHIELRSSIHQN